MTDTPQQEREAARTVYELTETERDCSVKAYTKGHGFSPDLGFAPDRAWLEGFAQARATLPQRDRPLTKQGIIDIYNETYRPVDKDHDPRVTFARAIEAAHGITSSTKECA